jgi:hypothetical protein
VENVKMRVKNTLQPKNQAVSVEMKTIKIGIAPIDAGQFDGVLFFTQTDLTAKTIKKISAVNNSADEC